eukprot:Gregarina_sp_Poly_1__6829@NODE_369_length_9158_cov_93_280497_g305_i0_p2_GENE_NODE_369_length_9158_cov_93_280497_g305_i0NODE_369_length_9158_cov_93_280497_g305_i0_p2_ORF_typecomplete_len496_score31_53Nucleoside_tran/PF01733_18/4e25_NODE_369_length_9158_cov_93_280497_g305_i034094896
MSSAQGITAVRSPHPETGGSIQSSPYESARFVKGDLEVITSASYDLRAEASSDEGSIPTPSRMIPMPVMSLSSGIGNVASPQDYIECTIIFTILGCLAGFFWEAMLNCLPTICSQIFPQRKTFSDEITGVFNTAILIAAGILSIVSPLRKWVVLSGTSTLTACSVLVGILCTFNHQNVWAPLFMILVNFAAGIATGLSESSTFAYALCLHSTRFAGCFSTGFGLAGILSLFCWMLWSRVFWPGVDLYSAQRCIWAQQTVSAFIGLISFAAFIRFTQIQSYKIWKAELPAGPKISSLLSPLTSRILSKDFEVKSDEQEYELSLWEVIKATRTCQWHLGLVLFITYVVVPNLVPLVLLDSRHQQDILVGIFQTFDFVGRFGANLDHYFPWVKIPERYLVLLSYGRLILMAMALKLIVSPLSMGMGSFWIQSIYMGVVGLSNGWFLTLFMMYLGRPLKNDQDKGRATAISVMTQLLGVVLGLYFVNITKTLYLPSRIL